MAEAINFIPGNQIWQMQEDHEQVNTLPDQHDEAAFEIVFKAHFKRLHAYAFTFVKDNDVAEDMVQNTFVKLWERSPGLRIHTSVSAYLYRSVYHECLNYLKHEKVKAVHETHSRHVDISHAADASAQTQLNELQHKLNQSLAQLPEGCRTVFQLSRFESLKYQEIADKLGISIKTVENQMGKALKLLRSRLIDYLPFLFFMISLITIN